MQQLDVSEIQNAIDISKVNWVNVHGLNESDKIVAIGEIFGADHLIISDILNTTKRTKLEEYHDILFFNVKSLLPIKDSDALGYEQISFFC